MPKFSQRSKDRLATCDKRLQDIMNEAIKEYDFSVLEGHRSLERQYKLYKEGRSQIDGRRKMGKHNYSPSLAVDIVPYPIDWNDIDRFKELAVIIKRIAKEKSVKIVHGGDWKSFKDYPHWQI
jgi:peptidoglycan L-alanyl-D-glutamate endopeptidase CwlK